MPAKKDCLVGLGGLGKITSESASVCSTFTAAAPISQMRGERILVRTMKDRERVKVQMPLGNSVTHVIKYIIYVY
jgi:hypothetical protein